MLSLAPILGRERLRALLDARPPSPVSSPPQDDPEEHELADRIACIANSNNPCISNARREAGGSPNALGNGHVKKRGRHYKRFSSFSMPHFPNLPTIHLPRLPPHRTNSALAAEVPQTGVDVRTWREQLRETLGGVVGSVGGAVSGAIGGGAQAVPDGVGGPEWRRRERERELDVLVREKRDIEREV